MGKEDEKVAPALTDESFTWDQNEQFFGIPGTQTTKSELEEVVEQVKTTPAPAAAPKKVTKPATSEEVKEEEEDVTFFESTEDAKKREEASKTKKKEQSAPPAASEIEEGEEVHTQAENDDENTNQDEDKEFFKTAAKLLVEKGVLQNIEIKDDEEIDGERFIELQDEEIEARVQDSFDAFSEDLDEDGKAFLKYKKAGGDSRVFFNAYAASLELPTSDITTPEGQEAVLRHYYKTIEQVDPEDVDDKIEWAKENKKMEKYAEKYNKIITERDQARKDQLLANQVAIDDQNRKAREEFQSEMATTLNSIEKVKGVTFTKEDKRELLPYATKPTVKIAKNKYITELQADLKRIFDNKEELFLLSKIVKSKFDLKAVKQEAVTTRTQQIKKEVFKQRDTGGGKSSGGLDQKKGLSDYF